MAKSRSSGGSKKPRDGTGNSSKKSSQKGNKGSSKRSGQSGGANEKIANLQATQIAAQIAQQAAQQEFVRQRFEVLELPQFQHLTAMDKEKLAFERSQQTFTQAIQEAAMSGTYQGIPTRQWLATKSGLTGEFKGRPTLQAQQVAAQLTGQWNGQDTLERAQLTGQLNGAPTWARTLSEAGLTGQYGGGATLAGRQQGLAEQQAQAGMTGYVGGAPTLERERFMAQQGLERGQLGLQEAGVTGRYGGAPTLAREQMEQDLGLRQGQLSGYMAGLPTLERERTMRELATRENQLSGYINGAPTLEREQMLTQAGGYLPGGAPTLEREQFGAGTTGYYGGAPTMAREEMLAQQTGYLGGDPTMAREQWQTGETGYLNGAPTMAREREQNSTAMQLLNLVSSLRGPKDAAQLAKVLNGTPQGIRDIVDAAAGRFELPGFGGGDPGALAPVSLQDIVGMAGNNGRGGYDDGSWPGGIQMPYSPGQMGGYPARGAGGFSPMAAAGPGAALPGPAAPAARPGLPAAGDNAAGQALRQQIAALKQQRLVTPPEEHKAINQRIRELQGELDATRVGGDGSGIVAPGVGRIMVPEGIQPEEIEAAVARRMAANPNGGIVSGAQREVANHYAQQMLRNAWSGEQVKESPIYHTFFSPGALEAQRINGDNPWDPNQSPQQSMQSNTWQEYSKAMSDLYDWYQTKLGAGEIQAIAPEMEKFMSYNTGRDWAAPRQVAASGQATRAAQAAQAQASQGAAWDAEEAQAAQAATTWMGQSQTPAFSYAPPGEQAPKNAYNYQPSGLFGGYQVYPPGATAPPGGAQVSTSGPVPADQVKAMADQALSAIPYTPPNQINAKNFNNMIDYQRDLLMADYEARGWDVGAAKQTYERALPQYGTQVRGRVSVGR